MVADKDGVKQNVVLGYGDNAEYLKDDLYLGTVAGRYCNRIKEGKLTLQGQDYALPINNGPNSLHGGLVGFDSVLWDVEQADTPQGQSLTFSYLSKDGEENYPGNLQVKVIYTLTEDNSLNIVYQATTDKTTVVNLTQHSYFDLSAGKADNALQHKLMINADAYLPTDATAIPLAEAPATVTDTPFDFRNEAVIESQLDWKNQQIEMAAGFDHTYVLNKAEEGELSHAATLTDPMSGRCMEVFTTEPGMQFYTGNYITENMAGADGRTYTKRTGVCLETQHYPDAPNRPDFPTTLLSPGQTFRSETQFKFSVK